MLLPWPVLAAWLLAGPAAAAGGRSTMLAHTPTSAESALRLRRLLVGGRPLYFALPAETAISLVSALPRLDLKEDADRRLLGAITEKVPDLDRRLEAAERIDDPGNAELAALAEEISAAQRAAAETFLPEARALVSQVATAFAQGLFGEDELDRSWEAMRKWGIYGAPLNALTRAVGGLVRAHRRGEDVLARARELSEKALHMPLDDAQGSLDPALDEQDNKLQALAFANLYNKGRRDSPARKADAAPQAPAHARPPSLPPSALPRFTPAVDEAQLRRDEGRPVGGRRLARALADALSQVFPGQTFEMVSDMDQAAVVDGGGQTVVLVSLRPAPQDRPLALYFAPEQVEPFERLEFLHQALWPHGMTAQATAHPSSYVVSNRIMAPARARALALH